MDNKTPQQLRAERQKYLRIQRGIRMGAIAFAIILSIISLCVSCSTKKSVEDLAAQLRAKKIAQAQEELQAAQASASPAPSSEAVTGGTTVTLSFVGSCTLGMDENDGYDGSFGEYYDNYGAGYFFQNVKSIFEGDDLTVASLESTLTLSDTRQDRDRALRADPSYADILTQGGIDATDVANDHIYDYGNEGYVDTLANLDNAGIGRFGFDNVLTTQVSGTALPNAAIHSSMVEQDGISIGLVGVWQDSEQDYESMALDSVNELQEQKAQIIVVMIHWSSEDPSIPDDGQISLAHSLINAGADLIIGIQPQAMQGIECYQGKYIVYSLGSFLSGDTAPESMDTMIFQQTFTVVNGEAQSDAPFEIIPCSISTDATANTYCPTPASGDDADRILDEIYALSDQLDGGIRPEEDEA